MPAKSRRFLVSIFLSGLSFCLFSCAEKQYSLTASRDFQMTATGKENKIPLRAALYITLVPKITQGWGTIDLGEAFSSGCERMLKNIFREVVSADLSERQEFDVMVKPEIIRWQRVSLNVRFWVHMDVVWNIYSPEGKIIYSNTVKNSIESTVSTISTVETKVNEVMAGYVLALNDQLVMAQDDLHSSKWWAKKWWQ